MKRGMVYTLGLLLIGCYQSTPITLEIELEAGIADDGGSEEEAYIPPTPGSLHRRPNPSLSEVAEAAMMVYLLWQRARCTCHHGEGDCPWGLATSVNPEAVRCLERVEHRRDDFYLWLHEIGELSPRYLSCAERHGICPGRDSGGRCYKDGEFDFQHLFSIADEREPFVNAYNRCVREELVIYP